MVCNIAVRLGDGACMPYVVPGSTIAMRTRLRTLGGIQVGFRLIFFIRLSPFYHVVLIIDLFSRVPIFVL